MIPSSFFESHPKNVCPSCGERAEWKRSFESGRPGFNTLFAWIGYIFLDDFGRTKPAFLNSTGVMYPSVECILKLLYQCT